MEENQCCCCHKTTEHSEEEYRGLMNRLKRIEGQIRGLEGMLEKNAYCVDILTQAAAANAALNAFCRELLANHMRTCVAEDIKLAANNFVRKILDVFCLTQTHTQTL